MGPQAGPPFKRSIPSLLLITSVFFCNFIARIILTPFLIHLESEFGLSHVQAGGLFLIISLGLGLALLVSGFVSRALTHRRTIVFSAMGVGLALGVVAWSRSLALLQIGLFILGAAAGLYFPSGIATISSILRPSDWGKGFAVHELAPNLSFLSAPLLALFLGPFMTWRAVFMAIGMLSVFTGLAVLAWGRGGELAGEPPRLSLMWQIMRRREFWLLSLLFGLAIAANVAPYSMLPLFLVEARDASPDRANILVTVSRLAGPGVVLLTGWIIDRLGAGRTAVVSMGVTGLFTLCLGLLHGPAFILTVILQPVLSVCYFPAGLTLLSQQFETVQRNVAVSLIIPVALLFGTGLMPTMMGWFGDHGRFDLGFVLLGSLLVLGTAMTRKSF